MRYTDERPSRVVRRSKRFTQECRRLGLRVRQLRQERELTLEAASTKMNVDITHLQKIEAGTVNVSMVTLVRISEGLSVDLAELFRKTKRAKD